MNSNTVQFKQLRDIISPSDSVPANDQEFLSHVEKFYEFEKFVQASKQVQDL